MQTIMNNLTLSQTEPISSLPRDYSNLLIRAKKRKEPVIFLKRNKPIGALLSWEFLKELMEVKRKLDKEEALNNILQSEKDYKAGRAKILKSLAKL